MTRRPSDASWRHRVFILEIYRILFPLAMIFELQREWPSMLHRWEGPLCMPIEVFELLQIGVLSLSQAKICLALLLFFLATLSLGLLTRISAIISFILFFLLIGSTLSCAYGPNQIYMNWQHAIVVFNLLILSVSRAGSVLSVDYFLFNKNDSTPDEMAIFLLKFNLVFSYFAGGIAKLRWGWDWANGYTLQYNLKVIYLQLDLPWLLKLIPQIELLKWFSCIVLIVELVAPLALFWKPFAILFVVGSLFFQAVFWWLIELRWMYYYGWSYLIYVSEVLATIPFFLYLMSKTLTRREQKKSVSKTC